MIKRSVDVSMAVLMIILMAFQYTGEEIHEWIGTSLFVVVLIHQILNIKWYQSLAKGKYTPVRIAQTILNLLLVMDILLMMVTGMIMSGYVFTWLPIHEGFFMARKWHLAGAHWGYIFMSMHMGMHFVMMSSIWRRVREKKNGRKILLSLRILKITTFLYGIYAFIHQGIYSYLFFQTEYYQWGAASNVWIFTVQNICMMLTFGFIADTLICHLDKLLLQRDIIRQVRFKL